MAAPATYSEGSHAALLPAGAEYDSARNIIVLPAGAMLAAGGDSELGELTTRNKNPGVFFTISLLLVVFITNTPLRWSLVGHRGPVGPAGNGHARLDGAVGRRLSMPSGGSASI